MRKPEYRAVAKATVIGKLCLRIALLVPSLTGCAAVGPDWIRPVATAGDGYAVGTESLVTAPSPVAGGTAQQLVSGRDIPADWWAMFRSPALTELVQRALLHSPSIEAAKATLRQAQALAAAQHALELPTLGATFGSSRQEQPQSYQSGENTPALVYNDQSIRLDLSYAPDFWGSYRRAVEQARAQVDYQRFQLEAAYLALSAGVVSSAIQASSLQQQIKAQTQLIDFEQTQLDTVRQQFELGGATGADVATQQAQLAQAHTMLIPLRTQLDAQRHQLAAYLGTTPADGTLPNIDLDRLTLPAELPLSLPSALLEQRPDVRAAEALLHQQTAALGVAMAQRLPSVTLGASLGSDAGKVGQWFSPTNVLWSLTSQAVQSIFDGGQLKNRQLAQRAQLEAAAAQWRLQVVEAFQNVADVLSAVRDNADMLHYALTAEQAAGRSLWLASEQYKLGGASYLSVLSAQQTYQTAVIALIKARTARYMDSVSLFQALGGGWWHRDDTALAIGGPTRVLR